jgi:hypothetical protein
MKKSILTEKRYYCELAYQVQESYGDRSLYILSPVPDYLTEEYFQKHPSKIRVMTAQEAESTLENMRVWSNRIMAEKFWSIGD